MAQNLVTVGDLGKAAYEAYRNYYKGDAPRHLVFSKLPTWAKLPTERKRMWIEIGCAAVKEARRND